MRKAVEVCKTCHDKRYLIVCDTCGEDLFNFFHAVPITIEFSYPHDLDEGDYHFCNNRCAAMFFEKEIVKTNPKNMLDILYGSLPATNSKAIVGSEKIKKIIRKANKGKKQ